MNKIRANCAILDMTCEECEEDCPEAGERLKAETKAETKKWIGAWPTNCQFCGTNLALQEYFVDGKTLAGPWALMCPICWSVYGTDLGLGKGQKYDSKTLELKLCGERSSK